MKMSYKISDILKYRVKYTHNNKIIINKKNGKKVINPFYIKGLKIRFKGKNNTINLYEPLNFKRSLFTLKNDCEFNIYPAIINNTTIHGYNSSFVTIEEGSEIGGLIVHMENEKNTTLHIDKDAVLSYNIQIWTTDTHPIFDLNTNQLINNSQSTVYIGKDTWICANVILLKGAEIPTGSIVGNGSVVTKKFSECNCVIAGNPAQIVKHNIYKKNGPIS